jgi:intracellular septation protein
VPAVAKKKKVNPFLKFALEMGPLGLFFVANYWPNLFSWALKPYLDASYFEGEASQVFTATPVFMLATIVSLTLGWTLTRHIPIMPLVSGVVVLVFGALTIWMHDKVFIQIKPTIVNSLYGIILLGGLWFGRPLLRYVLEVAFELTEEGWRALTLRWGLFFFVLAGLNEIVRLFCSYDFWTSFKVFGTMPITMLFAASQVPLMLRHEVKNGEPEPETESLFD